MKMEVFDDVLRRLRQSSTLDTNRPGFEDDLWNHFNRLPARYALDVNVERAEDVLMHQRMLLSVYDPHNRPAVEVRLVQVQPTGISAESDSIAHEPDQNTPTLSTRKSIHPPPAFGSSPNLEALALQQVSP